MSSFDERVAELGDAVRDILKQFQSANTAAVNGPHSLLTHQEVRVVEFLDESGRQMMRAVAEFAGVAVNSITNIIDNLEQKKIVQRVRSESDRRVIYVQLTDDGKLAAESAFRAKTEIHRAILSVLSEQEQDLLLVLFRKIASDRWKHDDGIKLGAASRYLERTGHGHTTT